MVSGCGVGVGVWVGVWVGVAVGVADGTGVACAATATMPLSSVGEGCGLVPQPAATNASAVKAIHCRANVHAFIGVNPSIGYGTRMTTS
jgi:hypothetical protein